MDTTQIEYVIGIALVLEKLFEIIFGKLWEHFKWDPFYKLYAAIFFGSVIAWFTGFNILPVFEYAPIIGRVLTSLIIGCGTSFIYDLVDKKSTVVSQVECL